MRYELYDGKNIYGETGEEVLGEIKDRSIFSQGITLDEYVKQLKWRYFVLLGYDISGYGYDEIIQVMLEIGIIKKDN